MLQGSPTPRYPVLFDDQVESAFLAQGCLSRTLAMHSCLRFGAALVCVVYDNAPAPLAVKSHSYEVNHIQYARQLVLTAD
jgi:hypothetical protein